MREEDWPTTSEGIAALLSRWDSHEPLDMTSDEEVTLKFWRRNVKSFTIANMQQGLEELFE
jgi:hypothetical protein